MSARVLGLAAALTVLSPLPARGAESNDVSGGGEENATSTLSAGAEADFDSRFVWRAMSFNEGAVSELSTWASAAGLNATVWATLLLSDRESRRRVASVVPALLYSHEWRAWKVEPAVFVYVSPYASARAATVEASLDLSFRLGSVLLVSGTKVDLAAHAGAYFGTAGAAYERASHRWTVKTRLEVGWANETFNQAYLHNAAAALNLVELSLLTRYDVTDVLYLAPHTEVSILLAPSGRSKIPERVLINGGTAVGIQF